MIQEELRNFIEQNCSGKEPSDLIMEAIGQKIEQLGADADEVLAFVEECAKGPTLEKKAAEQKELILFLSMHSQTTRSESAYSMFALFKWHTSINRT